MNYLYQIGYFGPMTLLILILFMFSTTAQPYNIYLYIYVIAWQFLNHFSNIVIKNTLKHPRPDSGVNKDFKLLSPTLYNYFSIHRNFGMPSGHAQQVFSELTFITLYFRNPILTTISIIQSCITLWQRYYARKHSIKQLAVGSLIGILSGVIFYKNNSLFHPNNPEIITAITDIIV